MKTKVSDRKALLHLAVRILTLPPIVIGVTLLLMYAPTGLLTRRELLLCEPAEALRCTGPGVSRLNRAGRSRPVTGAPSAELNFRGSRVVQRVISPLTVLYGRGIFLVIFIIRRRKAYEVRFCRH